MGDVWTTGRNLGLGGGVRRHRVPSFSFLSGPFGPNWGRGDAPTPHPYFFLLFWAAARNRLRSLGQTTLVALGVEG